MKDTSSVPIELPTKRDDLSHKEIPPFLYSSTQGGLVFPACGQAGRILSSAQVGRRR